MELTVEQALQQRIAAHKEGKLQEAEQLYRAALGITVDQFQPSHPDANHNLGVIGISYGRFEESLV